jgi:transcriptional regulator with GAF, ATPase, and Fis domain
VFPVELPPLRDRPEDIGPLAAHFVDLAARRLNRPEVRLTNEALEQLTAYDWPGNIRELRNVIERAVILSLRGPLRIDRVLGTGEPVARCGPGRPGTDAAEVNRVFSREELSRHERDNIIAALDRAAWKVSGSGGAAEILGVKPTTLASRLKRFGIKRPR